VSLDARIIALAQAIGADIKALISGKVDKTGAVTSVAGRTGAVGLTKTDVGLPNAENTADNAKPVSSPQQAALDLKAPLANPNFTGNMGVTGVITCKATIELGDTSGVGTPAYIDLHSGTTAVDRDGRILCQGGTGSNDGGDIRISAATITAVGVMQTTAELRVGGTAQILAALASVNGDITASRAAGNTSINMNGPTGAQKRVAVYTGLSARWTFGGSNGAESGSNVGTDFWISRFSDAGAGLSTPLVISRSTGQTTLESLAVSGASAFSGLSSSGDITVSRASGNPSLLLNGISGSQRALYLTTSGSERWRVGASTAAEAGSNVGSDFFISRYSDAGSGLSTPVAISRSTGRVTLSLVTVNGEAVLSGPVSLGSYTLTTLPSASTYSGYYITVTNATGGAKLCYSNGTNWLIANTTTIVS